VKATYNGQEALTFNDFIDLDTGRTLFAEPGGVYDIAPASGRIVEDVPAPWFTAAEGDGDDGEADDDQDEAGNDPAGAEPAHDEDEGSGQPE
jgi:hypothetical protein